MWPHIASGTGGLSCIKRLDWELNCPQPSPFSILWAAWWNNYLIKATAKNLIARTQFQRKTELPNFFWQKILHAGLLAEAISARVYSDIWDGAGKGSLQKSSRLCYIMEPSGQRLEHTTWSSNRWGKGPPACWGDQGDIPRMDQSGSCSLHAVLGLRCDVKGPQGMK